MPQTPTSSGQAKSRNVVPPFIFKYPGSEKPLAWTRYKLKECWMLVLCLWALRGFVGGAIIHNAWASRFRRFTREFQERRAHDVDPTLAYTPILSAQSLGIALRFAALLPAVLIALLPIPLLVRLVVKLLPKKLGSLVVFCDGHLSGFVIVLAAKRRGIPTLTLQHGLYRLNDIGSIMVIQNFVADRICLWDQGTINMFREAGAAPERLLRTGEYGFSRNARNDVVYNGSAILCPAYDESEIALFRKVEAGIDNHSPIAWSLHPFLRERHSDLNQMTLSTLTSCPSVAICGDSGVIMEALALRIPIVTISDRVLASNHLTLAEAERADAETLSALIAKAKKSIEIDLALFGFDTSQ